FLSNFLSAVSSEGVVTADTSIQGHYSIDALTPGNYLVMAEYQDNFVEGFWLDAVTISRGEQVIDLNQNTFVNVPLIEYLRQASACDECLGNDSIPARRFLVEAGKKAIEERERVLKELEDTVEEFERAMRRLRGG
ncbi:carboxypeptidase-like regulatory domain-containing protein, partial [Luminiphilus sp.]|nr:carboxypeptidase-like regulatory domain-containing protein [Luminiphilus sp.]